MHKIILDKVASYTEKAELETDKKINLIYGLNGVGKTILSNYLHEKNKKETTNDFKDCSDNFDPGTKIFVYNEKFIEDNFYTTDKIKGIFTLSSENKQALEGIKKAKEELEELNNKKKELKEKRDDDESKFKEKKEEMQEKIWKIKEEYTGGDRPLDYCLEGLKGDKEKLFTHLKNFPKPEERPQKEINDLQQDLKLINKGQEEKPITKIDIQPGFIENNSLFKEEIVGTQSSSVVGLIKKLQNSDWVKQGLDKYLPKDITESTQCPFCQEKTITQSLVDNIKKYFDESYRRKIHKISELQSKYEDMVKEIEKFKKSNLNHYFIKEKKDQFEVFIHKLKECLEQNLSKITNKKDRPSQKISLNKSNEYLDSLNKFIDDLNNSISEHNTKIRDSKTEKEKIKDIFWKIMRYQYDRNIEFYNDVKKNWLNHDKKFKGDLQKNQDKIKEQNKIVQENQKNTVNVEKAVFNINENFKNLGISDFKIEKQTDEEAYFLKRSPSSGNSNFKSFSEGEKTIISFLYFLELCKGRAQRDEVPDKKIVVIDDPISSLSHIYIFNIAQFIKNHFFNNTENNYQKVFVLTHSLYFFHELASKLNDAKFFRITKNNSSHIHSMKKSDIKNDYESYWEILKDFKNNKGNTENTAILPNVMRNIMEHFFGFIDKKDNFIKSLEKIDKQKYGAFIRYMNRESHSDRENISDMKEIDHNLFFAAFKEVFKNSGYNKHYHQMMNNKNMQLKTKKEQ